MLQNAFAYCFQFVSYAPPLERWTVFMMILAILAGISIVTARLLRRDNESLGG